MRLSHFDPLSSPIPHRPAPTPLARSPTSLLGLTTSQLRRRANTTRASSSEPTVPYGLANWRRQPKKPGGSGTGTGTASTGSTGTSGRGKQGAGMGMKGTPAKKGKRSYSKSMGAHSTPAMIIYSRSKSHSTAHSIAQEGIRPQESTSSLDSSFPSSAEFLTPSPISQIPDLSSPSIPAILPSRRRLDVFDSDYAPQPREKNSEEVEDWEALVQQAGEEELPEEIMGEERGDDLYGWKQDTMWSLQGSSASTIRRRQDHSHDGEDEEETGTIQEHTIYNDLLITMNDQTRPSLSSRTEAMSSTIKNRQPTPRRSRPILSADRQYTAKPTKTSAQSPGVEVTRVFPRSHDISDALLQDSLDQFAYPSLNISLNDLTRTDDPSSRTKNRAGKIRDRKSTPHKSSSQKNAPLESDEEVSPRAIIHEVSAIGGERVLSQLLESSHPTAQDNLSQLLQSTQSTGVPADPHSEALGDISMGDISIEVGRTGLQHSMSPMSPLPDIPHCNDERSESDLPSSSVPLPFEEDQGPGDLESADKERISTPDQDEFVSTSRFRWHPYDRNANPVPYTPSSHLSPASLRPPLTPLSFLSTPPASLHSVVSPPPPAKRFKHPPRSTRKGAWRGAEVLARMEAADRGTARYHMAFERLSPGSEDGSVMGAGSARRRELVVSVSVFEESELVLAARKRRLDHYRELEIGYRLHVELVL